MKTISLTQSKIAMVDDSDYPELSKYKWSIDSCGYAQRTIKTKTGYRPIRMHRVILNPQKGQETDHINGNRTDNRRENLRLCTRSQNCWNQHNTRKNKSSKYKGVWWDKRDKIWYAAISIKIEIQKRFHLGVFDDEIEAAKAYDKKAQELFGEFAHTNF